MDFLNEHFKLIISFVSSIIGLLIFLYSRNFYVKARKSKNWQTTEGIILTSDVVKETNNSSDYNSINYKAEVCYSYKILNKEFVSNKVTFMPGYSTTSSKLAYKRTLKYPTESKVQVFYNPENPEEAVLESGVKTEHLVFLSLTGLIFLTALGFLLYYLLIENV